MIQSLINWHWWFAWHPVKVIAESGDCWVWMCIVQRRETSYRIGNRVIKTVEYR